MKIEGPYGCFTFDDDCRRQIWIGGGIGITPFVARRKHMALQKAAPDWPVGQTADVFHSTADVDEEALIWRRMPSPLKSDCTCGSMRATAA